MFSGLSPDERLVEIAELAAHPFMVGTQFHPEFLSRPNRPHPLFRAFAVAFWLFAANQLLASVVGAADERVTWTYVLRVLGYIVILAAIVRKNRAGAA